MAERAPKRGPKAGGGRPAKITREQILEQARQLGGELSFTRLAGRLGVRQPALYYHFKSRDELFDALMLELGKAFVAPAPGHPKRWRSWLERTALDLHDFLLAHPSMFAVENWRGVAVPGLQLIEVVLETLQAAGFSIEEAGLTWEAISHMAFSHARLVHEVRRAGPALLAGKGRRLPSPGPRAKVWAAMVDRDPRAQFAKTLRWVVAGLPRPRS